MSDEELSSSDAESSELMMIFTERKTASNGADITHPGGGGAGEAGERGED